MKKNQNIPTAPNFLKYFNENNRYLVLNPIIPSFLITNKIGISAINLCNGKNDVHEITKKLLSLSPNITYNKVNKFLEYVYEKNIFSQTSTTLKHENNSIKYVLLNMTPNCNLKCKYCYASERIESKYPILTYQEYVNIIDDILSISPDVQFTFTGGEPLLSKNIFSVAQYLKEKKQKVYMLTNATLINRSNISTISKIIDGVRISLDGSNAIRHDFYRGNGTYNKTINAIKLLLDNNVDVIVAMVVTKQNLNDIKEMENLWGDKLTLQPLYFAGNAKEQINYKLTSKEYYETLIKYKNKIHSKNYNNFLLAQKNNKGITKCGIGDEEFSISCTGDVYPCEILHLKDFLIGNVHEKSIKELYYSDKMNYFKQHTVEKIEKCKDCFLRLICGGGCQAMNYYDNNTIEKASDFCEYEKNAIIHELLTENEPIIL
ncbi:MAG: radical SAM protein [Bdellovibrionota bacterium]|nr:radical SAM protein [Pseudomonadota bacterium]MDY6091476.1 radical SAM protein [Bdellovibrionota bacterium]